MVNESKGTTLDAASLRIAVTQMYTLLMSFAPAILKDKLAANPGAYSRILNSLCKLTEGSFRFEHRNTTTAPLPPAKPARLTHATSKTFAKPVPPSSILQPCVGKYRQIPPKKMKKQPVIFHIPEVTS